MLTKEHIERINQLAHKKKTIGLTTEETAEQKSLYRIYIDNIKQQIVDSLGSREVYADRANEASHVHIHHHHHNCECGCHHDETESEPEC